MGAFGRFAFAGSARGCYAVVLTGEGLSFGNMLINKGAIPPEDRGSGRSQGTAHLCGPQGATTSPRDVSPGLYLTTGCLR
jgi:hypothetical protein